MLHYVLLTRDDAGRSVIDSRVIDVDRNDGLDAAGRVNAGIDLMLTAARTGGLRVGPIGVAARTGRQRRELRSKGAGPRRQIHLVGEDEAVVAHLSATGQINRFGSVVIVDCGDTGMSMYTVDPATHRVSAPHRSKVLSGRALDRAIVDKLIAGKSVSTTLGTRPSRRSLLSACRTAKEEVGGGSSSSSGPSSILLADGGGQVALTADTIAEAAAPMLDDARKELGDYISANTARGVASDAVVLVGGLANLPAVRGLVSRDMEVVVPPSPELVAPIGAALLARARTTAETTSRLAFIGGRRNREWLSATPLAVTAAILAAALMTIYAVSSSLAGHNSPTAPQTAPTPNVSSEQVANTSSRTQSSTTVDAPPPAPLTPEATLEPVEPTGPAAPAPERRWDGGPGWATTELPPAPQLPSTTTRTLTPFPLPELPWPSDSRPTIPPGFLPPGMVPPSTERAPEVPAPTTSQPTTSQPNAKQPNAKQPNVTQPSTSRTPSPRPVPTIPLLPTPTTPAPAG